MLSDYIINFGNDDDFKYIDHLQKENAFNLNFYPKERLRKELMNKRILIARYNNEYCGYLYFGSVQSITKIFQACIQYDLRGRLYGSHLVGFFLNYCDKRNVGAVTLRCASDIEANDFWKAMGFYCQGISPGGRARKRLINHWRMDLQPQFFITKTEPHH